jgi:hypothetical protein
MAERKPIAAETVANGAEDDLVCSVCGSKRAACGSLLSAIRIIGVQSWKACCTAPTPSTTTCDRDDDDDDDGLALWLCWDGPVIAPWLWSDHGAKRPLIIKGKFGWNCVPCKNYDK